MLVLFKISIRDFLIFNFFNPNFFVYAYKNWSTNNYSDYKVKLILQKTWKLNVPFRLCKRFEFSYPIFLFFRVQSLLSYCNFFTFNKFLNFKNYFYNFINLKIYSFFQKCYNFYFINHSILFISLFHFFFYNKLNFFKFFLETSFKIHKRVHLILDLNTKFL